MKKIVFFGTPEHSAQVLSYFLNECSHEIEVVGVVTNPDRHVGRKKILTASPVKKLAKKNNIPVFTPEKFTDDVVADLQVLCADFFIIVAYGTLIKQNVIDIPTSGTFNLHFSLLPKYRGASPIQSALLAGDTESGISIFSLVKKMDAGDIYIQEKVNLRKTKKYNKNHLEVFDEMVKIGAVKLRELITDFYSLYPKPQNEKQATFCGKFQKSDGEVNLQTISKLELSKKYNAYFVWPGIFYFDDYQKRVKLIELNFDIHPDINNALLEKYISKKLVHFTKEVIEIGDYITFQKKKYIVLHDKTRSDKNIEFVEVLEIQREGKKSVRI